MWGRCRGAVGHLALTPSFRAWAVWATIHCRLQAGLRSRDPKTWASRAARGDQHCPELRLNAWSQFKWLSIRLVAAVCGRCLLGVPVLFFGDLLDLWPFLWFSFCVHLGNGAGISLICPGHIRFSFRGNQIWGIAASTDLPFSLAGFCVKHLWNLTFKIGFPLFAAKGLPRYARRQMGQPRYVFG